MTQYPEDAVAIIGAAVNFPGADDLEAFRRLVHEGREAMQPVPAQLLQASEHARIAGRPDYVAMNCMMAGHDLFDAGFFGLTPREAMLLDPQQRHLLQCAWQAHEHAGIVPGDGDTRRTGVFTSVSHSAYLTHYLMPQVLEGQLDMVEVGLANDKDFAPARLAYKLDLRGPAIAVQTACSSSLVALHLACRSLTEGECDLALVAASTIILPPGLGYLRPGRGMVSADGRCRPFSDGADGTIFASGAGAILLRPLHEALAAGDPLMAVIRGSATNNDGAQRAGFTAPSPDGQSAVIAEALAVAGVAGPQIGYVEAHGTATPLGDPIELSALAEALRDAGAADDGQIPLGSIKANLGHLDTAAGLAGLLKTVIALTDECLLPTPHAGRPSGAFSGTPLCPLPQPKPWPRGSAPRIAGVSAFGMGGSNAHVVVQEAPDPAQPDPAQPAPGRRPDLLLISARDDLDLDRRIDLLAQHVQDHAPDLPDLAHNLRVGRRAFPARAFLVADSCGQACGMLRQRQLHRASVADRPQLVFVLPGQGCQYAGLGQSLAASDPAFAAHRGRLAALLRAQGGPDIDQPDLDDAAMRDTWRAQAALFVNGAALGLTLRDWGLHPDAIIGHSVGEVAAALLSGALDEECAARLLVARARAMRRAPAGAMVLLETDASTAATLAGQTAGGQVLAIAAINAPGQIVVAGEDAAISRLIDTARNQAIGATRLATSHAFHTPMMADAAKALERETASLGFAPAQVAVFSTLTGGPLTPTGFGAPGYWGRQMLKPVRFAEALAQCGPDTLFVELGPPGGLAAARPSGRLATLLPHRDRRDRGGETMLEALGRIWLAGATPDWWAFDACWPGRRRLHLPGYPFRAERHWPATARPAAAPAPQPDAPPDAQPQPTLQHTTRPTSPPAAPRLPRQPRPDGAPAPEPCTGFAEQALAALWEDLLLISPIGRRDSFVALGGSSITALQLAQRAAEQGLRFTVADVFASQDLAELASRAITTPANETRPADTGPVDLESLNTIRAQLNGI